MLNGQRHGWSRCQVFQPGHLHHLASAYLVIRSQTSKVSWLGIYTWKVTSGAALARTGDDEKWTDVHGQVGRTIRGTGQCCGPHASAGASACLTFISLSVLSKKKKPLNYIWNTHSKGGKKVTKEVTHSLFWIQVSGMSPWICLEKDEFNTNVPKSCSLRMEKL